MTRGAIFLIHTIVWKVKAKRTFLKSFGVYVFFRLKALDSQIDPLGN